MTITEIRTYIEAHYHEFPNFDGRTIEEVLALLPDQDARYGQGEEGLIDLLNEIDWRD